MFRVSPAILGMTENVNRANMDAAFYLHAMINIQPRVRQFTRQIQATLVSVYDSTLELEFENPVPEDVSAKLNAAEKGVNKWWTMDEVRAMYGDDELPGQLGQQMYVPANTTTLDNLADPNAPPTKPAEDPLDPDDDDDDPTGTPDKDSDTKALTGVKKKT
jgi:hypothetical protein